MNGQTTAPREDAFLWYAKLDIDTLIAQADIGVVPAIGRDQFSRGQGLIDLGDVAPIETQVLSLHFQKRADLRQLFVVHRKDIVDARQQASNLHVCGGVIGSDAAGIPVFKDDRPAQIVARVFRRHQILAVEHGRVAQSIGM